MSNEYKSKMIEKMSKFAIYHKHDLVVATASSLIIGTPVMQEDDMEDVPGLKVFIDTNELLEKDVSTKEKEETPILKGVILKNVTIQSTANNFKSRIPFLIIFADEILGVSVSGSENF